MLGFLRTCVPNMAGGGHKVLTTIPCALLLIMQRIVVGTPHLSPITLETQELTFKYIWTYHLFKNNKGCALVGTKTTTQQPQL